MLVEMVIDGLDVPEDGSARDSAAGLLVRVAAGDQRAFAELYDLLSPRVFALILRVDYENRLAAERAARRAA